MEHYAAGCAQYKAPLEVRDSQKKEYRESRKEQGKAKGKKEYYRGRKAGDVRKRKGKKNREGGWKSKMKRIDTENLFACVHLIITFILTPCSSL